ncbi:hypothetical protein [uncultured Campylobacter sp.]|uniref:hypothetical protein n=1 Tax=uncultured Campylobacter sp. TaxID=218934 RepID=UPI002611D5C3|nr:hypothetical protein [uncultured Campylobacter sp.]
MKIYTSRENISRVSPLPKYEQFKIFAASRRDKISFCRGFANFLAAKFSPVSSRLKILNPPCMEF